MSGAADEQQQRDQQPQHRLQAQAGALHGAGARVVLGGQLRDALDRPLHDGVVED